MSARVVVETWQGTGWFLTCEPGERPIAHHTGREHVGIVTAGASTPWAWAKLPGHPRARGEDWTFRLWPETPILFVDFRANPSERPWLTSERREEGRR